MGQPTLATADSKALVGIILAVAEAIMELKRVPSGHLYAHLCGSLDLDTYLAVIRYLTDGGWVREKNHELIWVGKERAS